MKNPKNQMKFLEFYSKKGEKGKIGSSDWKSRYFSTKNNFLSYYKSKRDVDPLGIILIESSSFEPQSNKNIFAIVTKQRTYEISCHSEKDRNLWVTCLNDIKKILFKK